MPVPPPSEAARASALAAAMAAFDAAGKEKDGEPQENAAPARLTHASTQTQRRRLMRVNYFQYKIAASIAVLIVAAPMALYMYKQELSGPQEGSTIIGAGPESAGMPPSPAAAKSSALEPRDKAVYERLTPEKLKVALPAPASSAPEKHADMAPMTAPIGGAPTGDAEKKPVASIAAGKSGTLSAADAKEGGIYKADGRLAIATNTASEAAAAQPPAKPAPASPPPAVQYNPAPSTGSAVWGAPIGPLRAEFGNAPLQQFDKTQVFRFGAAPKFGGSPPSSPGGQPDGRVAQAGAQPPAKPAAMPADAAAGIALGAPIPEGVYDLSIAGYGKGGSAPAARLRKAQDAPAQIPLVGQLYSPAPAEEPESRAQFEAFASNAVKQVAAEPVSTFSIDVDTASYGFVRRSLLAGGLPPKDAVRVEEMVNYFPYAYPRPESAAVPFEPTVTVTPAPWKPTNKLVHIGIKGYEIAAKERPRANLVFLIDVSGSMAPDDRLPLLKNAFRMLVEELKTGDSVGIVTYASDSRIALEPVTLGEVQNGRIVASKAKILGAINRLRAGGSTAGGAGLKDAYRLAEAHFDKNAVNRIILATDGDFNVGISDHEELKRFIEAKRRSGIYLSAIGVGHDNYNDRLMQALAQNGNGVAAYADTLNEARKVLVDEASSSLFPIAKDVKIQVEFNPAQVSEYRLIGYETRALKREDFNNDHVDAGEIGSGHTVTAIYEITPVGAPRFVDDLRYKKPEAQPAPASGGGGELGFLKIRYKLPGEETSKLIASPIAAGPAQPDIQAAPEDVRFSIAVAAFGQMLRGDPFTAGFGYDGVIALAQTARGADPFGYRAEFLNLVRLAKSIRR